MRKTEIIQKIKDLVELNGGPIETTSSTWNGYDYDEVDIDITEEGLVCYFPQETITEKYEEMDEEKLLSYLDEADELCD